MLTYQLAIDHAPFSIFPRFPYFFCLFLTFYAIPYHLLPPRIKICLKGNKIVSIAYLLKLCKYMFNQNEKNTTVLIN